MKCDRRTRCSRTAPRGIQQGESLRDPQRPINHAGTSTGQFTASSTVLQRWHKAGAQQGPSVRHGNLPPRPQLRFRATAKGGGRGGRALLVAAFLDVRRADPDPSGRAPSSSQLSTRESACFWRATGALFSTSTSSSATRLRIVNQPMSPFSAALSTPRLNELN